jgi:hypothetical protein
MQQINWKDNIETVLGKDRITTLQGSLMVLEVKSKAQGVERYV